MDIEEHLNEKTYQQYDLDRSFLDKDDVTVVIPVLNEEEAIAKVLLKIKENGYKDVLVIDGYSTDDTVKIAAANGVKVIFQHGIGKTGAIKTAIEHIKTPYIIVLDGDYTYDPVDIKNFFPHIFNNDQVIGCRTFGRQNIPFINRLGNWLINFTFNLLFGTNLIDVCSGMYALKTSFAKELVLQTKGFDVEVEVTSQVASRGKITQVPISYGKRLGTQKLKPIRHGFGILTSIWRLAWIYNPVFLFSLIGSLLLVPSFILLIWVFVEWYRGYWHGGGMLLGTLLMTMGLMSLLAGTISILLKRMERRIVEKVISTKEM